MNEPGGDLELRSSCNGDGSNAILLSERKRKNKNKEKGINGKGSKNSKKGRMKGGEPPLSKSKQRKLKQLQEEKEKKAMLAKSVEVLEKYKIGDDAHCLLRSSGTIGQALTMREKRLRAAKFSKAGLEMLEDAPPSKRRKGDNDDSSCDNEEPEMPLADYNPSKVVTCKIGLLKTAKLEVKDIDGKGLSGSHVKPTFECPQGTIVEPEIALISESTTKVECIHIPEDQRTTKEQETKPHPCLKDQVRDGTVVCCPDDTITAPKFMEKSVSCPVVVHISRPKEIEEQRSSLPIVMMEQEIMEAINENSAVIICGETGCGKTTQVPQFLYEAGFGSSNAVARRGMIGITQPRRVAVLATAKRVSFELSLCLGKEVGFQVRYDKKLGENCSIKFMTDGILLRELQSDFLLKKYSVIILDEAHERSLNTDILIGMLSRIIQLRQKMHMEQQEKIYSGVQIKPEDTISQLKLVLMSATLRVEDFVSNRRLFQESPPVIEVPTRQFPVTTHFSKRTDVVDYVGQAYKKVLQIHKKLPPGGILVFVTGQREIEYLCKKLRKASQQLTKNSLKKAGVNEVAADSEVYMNTSEALDVDSSFDQQNDIFDNYEKDQHDPVTDSYSSHSDTESDLSADSDEDSTSSASTDKTNSMLDFIRAPETLASLKASFDALSGNEPRQKNEDLTSVPVGSIPEKCKKKSDVFAGALYVLPLYARLPASAQLRVFENVREGERLVVVATNVAETSLTIPGIKYVVDTGREKVRNYNHANGMETYEVQWISKASAAQRAGRAGRTGPGHCYRLYSSAAFSNIFSEFSCPQITKIPVDGVVLLMKFMGINKVAQFPFPTPPETTALLEAERCLKALEALDNKERLTTIGKAMVQFPMSPRHSRMLLTVIQLMKSQQTSERANLILAYAVAAAAALSFPNPFNMELEGSHGATTDLDQVERSDTQRQEKQKAKKLKALAREAHAKFCNPSSDALTISYALQLFELAANPIEFCKSNALHYKTMDEMSKLRKQLLHLIFTQSVSHPEFAWNNGNSIDVENAWNIRSSTHPLMMNEEEILGQAICAGWADRVAKRIRKISQLSEMDKKTRAVRYQSCALNETVFVHRWSTVSQTAPDFVVYTELRQAKRPYMHGLTSVKSNWLIKYASSLCSFSSPLADPKPYYEPQTDELLCWVSATFGPHLWVLPLHSLPIKNDMLRVSVFACALLEGNVLPCLKSAQQFLVATPSSILRPEALGQRRVGDLLSRLRKGPKMIDSRAVLRDTWKEDPHALYPELKRWFQEKFHAKFEEYWRRMQSEVLMETRELFQKKSSRRKKLSRNLHVGCNISATSIQPISAMFMQ